MNFKKVLSVVALVFLVVAAIALYNQESNDVVFFKNNNTHANKKSQLYPRGHRCATECTEQKKGFNCGRLTQSCCKSEELCVSEWGMKKCKERTDFECKIM